MPWFFTGVACITRKTGLDQARITEAVVLLLRHRPAQAIRHTYPASHGLRRLVLAHEPEMALSKEARYAR